MKIHHTAICVDDIRTAIGWYCQKLNFEIEYQDDSWALLSFENSRVALVLPEQHPPHLAFEVNNASSFGELTKHRDKTASIYINDPFGNTIELVEVPST
jgi:catechol 2,3-dioxygenase-like lactoylglutathione lyase family enzyme